MSYIRVVFRRNHIVVVLSCLLVAGLVSIINPAVADADLRHLTEADTDAAPSFDAHVTLLGEIPGEYYFYSTLYNHAPTLSGDGNWVVYPAETGSGTQLFRRSVATGVAERIGSSQESGDPAVSDDGRVVVYSGSEGFMPVIRRWEAGVGDRNISGEIGGYLSDSSVSDNGTTMAWNASLGDAGSSVVVWRDGDLLSRRAAPIMSHNHTDSMTVSGNGRFVFFNDVDKGPSRWDLSSGEVLAVADNGQVSDDGSLIAGSGPYLNDLLLGSAVTVHRVGGGDELLVRHPVFRNAHTLAPAFISGDGSTLMLSGRDPYDDMFPGSSHYLVDVASGSIKRAAVPFHAFPLAFSDDGTRTVLVETNFDGQYRLWLVDFDLARAPVAYADQLEQSQLSDQIVRIYKTLFDRAPSPAELLYWARQRAAGATLVDIATQFLSSVEFRSANGELSNRDYLYLLASRAFFIYLKDEYWLRELGDGFNRADLAVVFSEHLEVVKETMTSWPSPPEAAQVWRLYQAYFLRPADQAGLNYWLDLYWTGTPLADISNAMAASAEFVSRYGSVSDGEFIDRVYQNVLGRKAESSGRQYWITQLGAGLSRGQMMLEFSDSPEFIRTTDTIPPDG